MALIKSFQKTIAAAGTDEALQASTFKVRNFAIKALSTNAGIAYVGAEGVSASTGYPLAAGESVGIAAIDTRGSDGSYDLNKIWVDTSNSGDKVSVIYNFDETQDPS